MDTTSTPATATAIALRPPMSVLRRTIAAVTAAGAIAIAGSAAISQADATAAGAKLQTYTIISTR